MNEVYCFSGSGHGRAVAGYIAERLELPVCDMEKYRTDGTTVHDTVVAVFPVYSDNIPAPAKNFLQNISCEKVALIAVYGGVSHGNVLTQAAALCRGKIICGAYVPAGHTYLDQPPTFDRSALESVIERIINPVGATLPRERQSVLGSLFPEARARMLVRIVRSDECDHCGLCVNRCPVSAMKYDGTGECCLRCLRCVNICPKGALRAKYMPFLKVYLRSGGHSETIIYL